MDRSSIIGMEKSNPTNHYKNSAEILLHAATRDLGNYKGISSEARHNNNHAISLINQALALLTEFN